MRFVRILSSLALLLFFFTALSPAVAQDEVSWLLDQINCLRQSVGSPPLTMNVALSVAANRQAVNLANDALTNFHEGLDGSTPMSRAQDAGFSGSIGENVANGRQVSDPFNWWLNSSVHYENMTNAHWKEIGIGIATGPRGTWYTLVFGAMNWQVNEFTPVPCGEFAAPPPPAARENTSAASAPSVILGETQDETSDSDPIENIEPLPTPLILGLDEHGYIQHEIQSGETPGTIMLSYGYSWDALPTLMAINDMTEDEARNLDVGDIFLVPPREGMVTPTPELLVESTLASVLDEENDEDSLIIIVASDTPEGSSERSQPSLMPTATATATVTFAPMEIQPTSIAFLSTATLASPVVFAASVTPTVNSISPVAFVASLTPTLTPDMTLTAVALADFSTPLPPMPLIDAPPVPITPETSDDNTSLLLTIAIALQVVILMVAAFAFSVWRRR